MKFNPLNPELNPFCHLLALLGAHHILHVSRIRVNACAGNKTLFLTSHSLLTLVLKVLRFPFLRGGSTEGHRVAVILLNLYSGDVYFKSGPDR
jgi:hypothetical protein